MFLSLTAVVIVASYPARWLEPGLNGLGLAALIALRETCAFGVLAVTARRYLGLSLLELGVVRPKLVDVAVGITVGCVLIAISLATSYVLPKVPSRILAAVVRGSIGMQLAAVLMVGVWSPFVQELVFRGALLRALRERLSSRASVLVSAFVFAALHAAAGWPTVIAAFVDGVGLGALTLRRRTLTAAIAAHMTVNLVACVYVLVWRFIVRHRW
ncbi:MAG TPA: type II CAAX endopeptidase family protein [Candidatus Baltobacteraceae bacterium]|nr:type II CAAX endopeptidase family protein [Candidatus Baltobacteraceae bacterium]